MRDRTAIIGFNQTTPGDASAPSTLTTDGTANTGLLITQGSGAPASQVPLQVVDTDGTTVLFEVTNAGHVVVYNSRLGASFGIPTRACVLNGQTDPPCMQLADAETSVGVRIWGGTGAPSSSTTEEASVQVGDLYLRRDTPTTANQRVYICTAAGAPPTWSGIA